MRRVYVSGVDVSGLGCGGLHSIIPQDTYIKDSKTDTPL